MGALLLAWWASEHWVTSAERVFRLSGLLGAPLGFGLLTLVSRETAVELARIGSLSRWRLQPTGWYAQTAFPFLAWAVASLPCTCVVYAGALWLNAALASAPQALVCRAGSERTRSGALEFSCDRSVRGRLAGADAEAALGRGGIFAIDASRGALGIWIFEPGSVSDAPVGARAYPSGVSGAYDADAPRLLSPDDTPP